MKNTCSKIICSKKTLELGTSSGNWEMLYSSISCRAFPAYAGNARQYLLENKSWRATFAKMPKAAAIYPGLIFTQIGQIHNFYMKSLYSSK